MQSNDEIFKMLFINSSKNVFGGLFCYESADAGINNKKNILYGYIKF